MPLSQDAEKRARQLSNLVPGRGAAGNGNSRALRHGGKSAALVANVEAEVMELMDALAEAAPVKEHGELPAADLIAVERAARALKRWRHLVQWCDLHGRLDDKGGVKPAAKLEQEAERALGRALDDLGMTPASRARIGVDLAEIESYSMRMAREAQEAREAWQERQNGGGS